MDRRERNSSLTEAVLVAISGFQSGLWTALPAIVESFDPEEMTITAKSAIKARIQSPNSDAPLPGAILDVEPFWWVEMPPFVDVPVCFQGGGGFTCTFPIKPGDECLLVFSSRCIDNWWYLGEVQTQAELRKHDLSDAFAFIGVRSKPRALETVDPNNVELRSDDGTVKVELTPTAINITAPNVNVIATTKAVVTAPEVELSNGGTLRKLVNDLFQAFFNNHVHTSATAGNPTSAPTIAMDAAKLTSVVKAE